MATWDAQQYLRFADARTRPVRDLVAQIPLSSPARIVDLGCGPGNSTVVLAERFAGAEITGLDNSAVMIETARTQHPDWRWVLGEIAGFRAEAPVDLLFSNAALQWLSDHERLFPDLMRQVAPGGCFAVQMPRNYDEPVHRILREIAGQARWARKLSARRPITPVGTPAFYYDLLRPLAGSVEIWQTTYAHVMDGPGAIVEWMRGTGLRPYLEMLDAGETEAFETAYREAIASAYPTRVDGKVLLMFPRLFVLAQR